VTATTSATVAVSRRALLIGALVLFVIGLATKTLLFPADSHTIDAPTPIAAAAGPGPARVEAPGVPVGFAHSRDGALAASVAYVQLGDVILSTDTDSAADALRRVSSRSAGSTFVDSELASFTQLRAALARGSGPASLRVGVVATRTDAYSRGRARVSLWRVAVLSRDGMTNPGEQWATVTYDLVWEDHDWKIWSETVVAGPSPSPTGDQLATPQELDTSLAGFRLFAGVA
jgi:hypothetical protein